MNPQVRVRVPIAYFAERAVEDGDASDQGAEGRHGSTWIGA